MRRLSLKYGKFIFLNKNVLRVFVTLLWWFDENKNIIVETSINSKMIRVLKLPIATLEF